MLKVMIAEDDLLLADMLEEVLVDNGYKVCGIARTVGKAVELAERHKPDLAVLDIRLAEGGLGMEIAARMNRNGMGILYATGNSGQMGLTRANGEALLSKPYRAEDVVRALEIVEQIVSTGEATQPFPQGFHVLNGSSKSDTVRSSESVEPSGTARLHRQQAALARFGSFALGEHDLGKVLTEAARVCAEGLDVPFCKVCRYRSEENDLLVEAGVGWHQGVIGNVVSWADATSPQGRAFITGEPVICGDLTTDASFVLPAFYGEHGIVSTVDVVIKKDSRPYGVLEIDSPVQHNYDQHDIDFLTGFANVLAEVVAISKRNVALQNALDRMQEMVADRDRLLEAKNALLLEEKRLLGEKNILAQELQHRVRNNLQLVYGMLRKQVEIATDAVGKDSIAGIARCVMALAQVYDHLLGNGLSRTIDFGGYLASLCESFHELEDIRQPNIRLNCNVEPIVLDLDNVTALGLVVSELVANSYAHAFPDGTGAISVSLSRDEGGDGATVILTDDGVGFADRDDNKRRSLGLVRRLMEQVGGAATHGTEWTHGTKWTLRFPLPTSTEVDKTFLKSLPSSAPSRSRKARTATLAAPPRVPRPRKNSGGN
jgi:two-component sensor histidine kinase/ActR/RegA family two-component response regulator